MDEQEILSNLCANDPRNPDYFYNADVDDEPPEPRKSKLTIDRDGKAVYEDRCYCDNCFYGRDKLALEILRLKETIWDLEQRYVYEG